MKSNLPCLAAAFVSALAATLPARAEYAIFDSTTDSIALANGTTLGTTATIEAVFVPLVNSFGSIYFEQVDGQEYKGLVITDSGANGVALAIPSIGSSLVGTMPVALNASHHLAYVRDGAQERLYLDGTLVTSRTVTNADISDAANTAFKAAIGAGRYSVGTTIDSSFIGGLDSLRVSNVARYSGASITPQAGDMASDANTLLLLNFDFADVTGNVVADLSGNGRDGALGATFSGATSPTISATPVYPGTVRISGPDLAANEQPDGPQELVNPNATVPEWSYGTRTTITGTAFTPYTTAQHANDVAGFTNFDGWGNILVNAGTAPIILPSGAGPLRALNPGVMDVHSADTDIPVVRWTAPASGTYLINASWYDIDPYPFSGSDGASGNVVVNGVSVFASSFPNAGSTMMSRMMFVSAGAAVDFVLGKNANIAHDSTAFNVSITSAPTIPRHTSTWDSSTGNWSDASKWSTPTAPGTFPNNGASAYDAVMNNGALTVDVPAGITIQKLDFNRGTLTATNNLTMNEQLTISAPSPDVSGEHKLTFLNGAGLINATGGVTWQALNWAGGAGICEINGINTAVVNGRTVATDVINITGGMTINGPGVKSLLCRALNHGDGVNPSTATWSVGRLDFADSAVFTNKAASSFNNTFDGEMRTRSGTSYFINEGTFTKSAGTGATEVSIVFDNSGTVNVDSGTLRLRGGGIHTGNFAFAAGTTLGFDGGFHVLNSGVSFTGAGLVSVNGSALTVNTPLTLARFNLGRGSVNASSNITFNERLTLTSPGDLGGSNTLTGAGIINALGGITWIDNADGFGHASVISGASTAVVGGRTLATDVINVRGVSNLIGTGIKLLDRRALHHGDGANPSTTNWSAGTFRFSNNAVFINKAAAVLDTGIDGLMENQGGTNYFLNEGTFTKSAGTGTTDVQVVFDNSGTVNVNTGTLWLRGGGTQTGTFNVPVGKTLDLQGGHALNAGVSITGGGLTRISSGTTTANTPVTFAGSSLDLTGGTLNGPGAITVNCPATWVQGHAMTGTNATTDQITFNNSLAISAGSGGAHTLDLRTMNTAGTTTWGATNVFLNNNGIINNSGSWVATGFTQFLRDSRGVFNNLAGGSFTKSAGDFTQFEQPFNNQAGASVTVTVGSLNLLAGGTNAGSFHLGAGTLLQLQGDHSLNAGVAFTGSGNMRISSGSTTANTAVTFPATMSLELSGGALNGPGAITVNCPVTWSAGLAIGGSSTTQQITFNNTLTISGGGIHNNNKRTMATTATTNWTSNGFLDNYGIINNTGSWVASGDGQFLRQGGVFKNLAGGSFTKSAGTAGGFTNFEHTFTNAGTVNASSGSLNFTQGYTQTAGALVLNGGTVSSTTFFMLGGKIQGGGTISGAVSALGGAVHIEPGIGTTTTGILNITGKLTLTSGSKLSFDILGTAASSAFDRVNEGGSTPIDLAGCTLEVSLPGSFVPAPTEQYALVDGAATTPITGVFSNVANGARIATTDGKGTFVVRYGSASTSVNKTVVFLTDFQSTPTNLTLDDNQIVENAVLGTVVGLLSATDPDPAATFTFSLTDTASFPDNNQFQIGGASGNELQAKPGLDFETKSSYAIRLRVTNNTGGFLNQTFTIQVQDLPNPTDIALSGSAISENQPINTVVGALSATDPDPEAAFTFALVSGTGSTDNSRFNVSGNSLRTSQTFDKEAPVAADRGPFSIRVRATNGAGEFHEETLVISVTDLPAPTDITLAFNTITENQPAGTTIGGLSTTGPVFGVAFALVNGAGDDDNARFRIFGPVLSSDETFDFEATPGPFSIRVRTTSANGETYDEVLSITLLNQGPTSIALSSASVQEGAPVLSVVGTLSAQGDSNILFSLVSGTGSTDNALFTVAGNFLQISTVLDHEAAPTRSIRIRATGVNGEFHEQSFTIAVQDVAINDITLTSASVKENSPGAVVGSLGAVVTPAGLPASFQLVPGQDFAFFFVEGSSLKASGLLDEEVAATRSIRIRATVAGEIFEKNFVITVLDNEPDISVQQPLGTGLVDGAVLNFGGQPIGVSFPARSFTVGNAAGAAASLTSIAVTITGPDAAFFVLDTQGLATSLAVGASSTFRVAFQPDAPRAYNATLLINSNDPDESPFNIPLIGEGITPLMIAQTAYVKARDTRTGDKMGSSVAVSGNTLVVGAGAAPNGGKAYVFVRDTNTGSWNQQAVLMASNAEEGDAFGAVAISGDTIVIGAPTEDSAATGVNGDETDNSADRAGAAYVFQRTGTVWSQQAYLKASNSGSSDHFGIAVSISGDTIVVGAFGEKSSATGVNGDGSNNSASSAGAAYVFQRSGTTWAQQAYLKASNTDAGDQFGHAVAISGDSVIVGSLAEDSAATGVNGDGSDNSSQASGAAYVFQRSGGAWSQQAYLKASNTGAGDIFGTSVAIFGDTVVVGARFEGSDARGIDGDGDNDGANRSGAAYVFQRSGGLWTQQAYLKAWNTGALDTFGISVSITNDLLIVGAAGEDSAATGINGDDNDSALGAGSAYLFKRSGTSWGQQAYLKASNTGASDSFGLSVAVSANTIAAGAFSEDSDATGINGDGGNNNAADSGAAYIFEISQPEVFVHDGDTTGSPKLTDNQPQAVDFGPTPLDIPVTRSFTISNVRALPLTVSSITAPQGYTVVDPPTLPVAPQGRSVFSIRMNATSGGVFSGDVTITTDDSSNPQFRFAVSGEVIEVNDGVLDERFGIGGIARIDMDGRSERAFDMLRLPDGRIVIGGGSLAGQPALIRLLADGQLDKSFGEDGTVLMDFPGRAVVALAIQEGKIMAEVAHGVNGTSHSGTGGNLDITRHLQDGSLDPSFGNGGVASVLGFNTTQRGSAMKVLPSGKVMVAGTSYFGGVDPPFHRTFVELLNQNGSRNSVGLITNTGRTTEWIEDFLALPDGNYLACGRWRGGVGFVKMTSAGLFRGDAAFPSPVFGSVDIRGLAAEMAFQSDGKIVFCGRSAQIDVPARHSNVSSEQDGFFIGRLNANLGLDTAFGTGGFVVVPRSSFLNLGAFSMAVDGKDRMLVAGNEGDSWMIVRFLADGTLDSSFGVNGVSRFDLGDLGVARKVIVLPDGGLLVAGSAFNGSNHDIVIMKLSGSADPFVSMVIRNGISDESSQMTNGQAAAIDYGSRRISSPLVKSFRIENFGTAPLTINRVTVPAGFQVTQSPASVAAGSSGTLGIRLNATALGSFGGPVTITSNDPTHGVFTFPVTGQVVANSPPVYSPLAVGTVEGKPVTISFEKLIGKVTDANGDDINIVNFDAISEKGSVITQVEKSLVFSQPVPLAGTDSFKVRFSDGAAQVTGVVTVNVATDTTIVKNVPKVESVAGGDVKLTFSGAADTNYSIQQSPDNANFTQIGTAKTAKGKVVFTTTTPPPPNATFRIRQISLIPAP